MKLKLIAKLVCLSLAVTMISCATKSRDEAYSSVTGWKYNDKKGTGFSVKKDYKTQAPLGMVAIEGGTYTIGERGEFVTAPRNNPRRRITVSSFYIDQYEIRCVDWREYTNWMEVVFGRIAQKLVERSKPDAKIWREELAYNEPILGNYFSHPAFDQYPVVGVTWQQAMDYCTWRTDRVNELALIKAGIIAAPNFKILENETDLDVIANSFVFNTQKYLKQDSYAPKAGRTPKKDLYGKNRKVDMSDGILFSDYRLPTESEWEFAAYAIKSNAVDGLVLEGRIYPWSGNQVRSSAQKTMGMMQGNFVRGRGDMMGTAGSLNDKATITAPVNWYLPNDFGLYNMAGNVNEWVLDVYRATSFDVMSEYNSFRGNQYLTPIVASVDAAGNMTYKIDSLGRIATEVKRGDDIRNFKDGDYSSQVDFVLADSATIANLQNSKVEDPTDILRPEITDKTRVYKGGSWKDRIFWLNPSARRYLDEDKCSNDIGFRCAMSMIGNIEENKRKQKFKY
jgi:sulfatase modifying factor 1